MITYTWDIFRLDCAPSENGLTNVVKTIHWILQGQDENGISASMSNSYPLPSPTPESFTDYSTLAQETVIGWLESNLDVGYLQTYLANEIVSKYNPPITPLPLPWIKAEEPVVIQEETVDTDIGTGYGTGTDTWISTDIEITPTPTPIPLPLHKSETEEPAVIREETIGTGTGYGTGTDTETTPSPTPTLEEKIVDGYNPDANDGDDDGIVQEGTKWERPLGTEL
jgi:hypothetical protein